VRILRRTDSRMDSGKSSCTLVRGKPSVTCVLQSLLLANCPCYGGAQSRQGFSRDITATVQPMEIILIGRVGGQLIFTLICATQLPPTIYTIFRFWPVKVGGLFRCSCGFGCEIYTIERKEHEDCEAPRPY
jgi:hypothetical protein